MTRTAHILTAILTLPLLLTSAAFSFGQTGHTYNYAHVRYAEGGATIQRALEPEAGEATVNVPVMPGDRLWTSSSGRAEILFADGTVLRMDERTKVDFTSFGESAGAETLLRLWNGSLYLRITNASAASYRIDTPSGSIFPVSEGLIRIDVDESGSATLSVYDGVAELASESGSVLVRTGQRSFVQPGLRPEPAFEFNTALFDDFAYWSDGREQLERYAQPIEGVPDELSVYSGELQGYGTWRRDPSYGVVWYPTVSVGWSPYTVGRWSYTSFGWTWISYEPWGWAPYHYGRWGYGSLGWYWIPGSYWGPAWVSWAFGPTWVGWCPLGYYDRPLYSYRSVFDTRGGRAVSRYGGRRADHGWSFVKKDHFRSVPVERTRLRVEDVRATANQGRLFESGAILDRELRPVAVGTTAMSRAVQGSKRGSVMSSRESAASSRGGLRRGTTGSSPTLERSSTSRGSAVPRYAPAGSSRSGTTGSRSPVPFTGNTTGATGRSTTTGRTATGGTTRGPAGSVSNRGGTPSPFGLVRSGVQRGETAIPRSNDTSSGGRSSTPSFVRPGTTGRPGIIQNSPSSGPARTPAPPSTSSSSSTRGRAIEGKSGSSAGSRDFFGRGRPSVVGPRSQNTSGKAAPRTSRPSNNRSSQGASSRSSGSKSSTSSSSSRSSGGSRNNKNNNRNNNRGSSRPRN